MRGFIGTPILEPGIEHVERADYDSRLETVHSKFDGLVAGREASTPKGADLNLYRRYEAVHLRKCFLGKVVRGMCGIKEVAVQPVIRSLTLNDNGQESRRQLNIFAARPALLIGSWAIEAAGPVVTDIAAERLRMFEALLDITIEAAANPLPANSRE